MNAQQAGELLLDCLATGKDEARAARLQRLSAAGWQALVDVSFRHGVQTLLCHRLKALGPAVRVPPQAMKRLEEAYVRTTAANRLLYGEFADVLRNLQQEQVAVLALKGLHLARLVYANVALRTMADMDLLVKKEHLATASRTLLKMGYVQRPSANSPNQIRARHHLAPFAKPGAVPVEIHWTIVRLSRGPRVDPDGLWTRARVATMSGMQVAVLSPEDLLLHLCLHTVVHHPLQNGLKGFCDIAETLRQYQDEMDWDQVQKRARQWGACRSVYLSLRIVRGWLGASVPDKALETLQPEGFEPHMVSRAQQRILDTGDDCKWMVAAFAQFWNAPGFRDRSLRFVRAVVPSPQIIARMYSVPPDSARIWPYYIVHLRDLFAHYVPLLLRMLLRDQELLRRVERENSEPELLQWLASG